MKNDLQTRAQHTIEYPGRDLSSALSEAKQRQHENLIKIVKLKKQIQQAQYDLDQVECDYHNAVRAADLFENALNEQEGV